MEENRIFDEEQETNYLELQTRLKEALAKVETAKELREAKGYLIDVQALFKGLKLRREDREELYGKLQEAFLEVNRQIDSERQSIENEATLNYRRLKNKTDHILNEVFSSTDYRHSKNLLMEIQNELRDTRLLREQKDELYKIIRESFDIVKGQQEEERNKFENEARQQYERLKVLVDSGLKQAEETNQYKETREYLKKIQSEFKGTRMVHEQREELYSRLQTAFEILNKRLDEFFHQKKKNWEVKMQYRISEHSSDVYELRETLKKDYASLDELLDHLEIAISRGKDAEAVHNLKARIASLKTGIEKKETEILNLETEMNQLKNRFEPEES
ncbi:MAG: hypothetical protein NTX61_03305 [Bacteroidetes bacterium]|nr:hypothetical protein [Bacteroidota bacterium]